MSDTVTQEDLRRALLTTLGGLIDAAIATGIDPDHLMQALAMVSVAVADIVEEGDNWLRDLTDMIDTLRDE